jgi:hypothetical protein
MIPSRKSGGACEQLHLRDPTLAPASRRRASSPVESLRWKLVRHQIPKQPATHPSACQRNAWHAFGLALGLPMPRVEVIEVSDWLIEHTEDLRIQLGGQRIRCQSGKQLGSLYVGSPGMTLDYLR